MAAGLVPARPSSRSSRPCCSPGTGCCASGSAPWTLAIGALGWLAVLGLVLAAVTPGGSYLAALPALAGAVAGHRRAVAARSTGCGCCATLGRRGRRADPGPDRAAVLPGAGPGHRRGRRRSSPPARPGTAAGVRVAVSRRYQGGPGEPLRAGGGAGGDHAEGSRGGAGCAAGRAATRRPGAVGKPTQDCGAAIGKRSSPVVGGCARSRRRCALADLRHRRSGGGRIRRAAPAARTVDVRARRRHRRREMGQHRVRRRATGAGSTSAGARTSATSSRWSATTWPPARPRLPTCRPRPSRSSRTAPTAAAGP